MDKILSKDGKCELVENPKPTSRPCKGCKYDNAARVECMAHDNDMDNCMSADFNHEGTYIFKEIAKCQNTTA